jgi:perosamine synthetase
MKSVDFQIPVSKPHLDEVEERYLNATLKSGWISSSGHFIKKFEDEICSMTGTKYGIATNNGTSALHLALLSLGLSQGDEVIVPNITYIATANAVLYCGGIVKLVDVLPNSLNIDPVQIEKMISKKTKGIIVVHLYGVPCDVEGILRIAKKYNIWVVEDAAEALGSYVNGMPVCSFGDVSVLSFYGNKIITTGEGGMVLTNNELVAQRSFLLKGQAMDPLKRFWFTEIGYNYRMTNVAAALGLAQLSKFPSFVEGREHIFAKYRDSLNGEFFLLPAKDTCSIKSAKWLFTIFLRKGGERERDFVISELAKVGIESRPVFYPLSDLPHLRSKQEFPISSHWAYRGLSLPTFIGLSDKEIELVSHRLNQVLAKL